jgi:hypothetical protein
MGLGGKLSSIRNAMTVKTECGDKPTRVMATQRPGVKGDRLDLDVWILASSPITAFIDERLTGVCPHDKRQITRTHSNHNNIIEYDAI